MAGNSFPLKFAALVLIIVGAWFIMATILTNWEIVDYNSLTVTGASAYLWVKFDIDLETLFYVIFPMIGMMAVSAGIHLLFGKRRFLGLIMTIVMMVAVGMTLIMIFSDLDGILGFLGDAFESGDIVAALKPLAEPLLIFVFAVISFIMLIIGKTDKSK
jgi:hypothetical protein